VGEWLNESAPDPHRIPLRFARYSEASFIGPKTLVQGLGMSSLHHWDGWEEKIQIPLFLKHTMM
jgi:hypothetical protein